MLKENIKSLRKSKGLSQEELAIKLNVVRQTISKWEQGLSVPDAEMLISISELFETPVNTLLGENISEKEVNDLKAISEKLEIINLQLSQRKKEKQKMSMGTEFFDNFLCCQNSPSPLAPLAYEVLADIYKCITNNSNNV